MIASGCNRQMTFEEFKDIVAERKRSMPSRFALESDAPASSEMISKAEEGLNATLPPKFKAFLSEFGGGDFGTLSIFSVDPNGYSHIVARNRDPLIADHKPNNFIVISDDSAGGFHGFRVIEGVGQEQVDYWDWESGEFLSSYDDVFEFIAEMSC